MKQEEWLYHAIPHDQPVQVNQIDSELQRHLVEHFGKDFSLENKNGEALTRFYLNSLRLSYIRVARKIRNQWLDSVAGKNGRVTRRFAISLWNSLLFPKSLEAHELSPQQAKEILSNQPWTKFPWQKGLKLMELWSQQDQDQEYSRRGFYKWVELQSDHGLSDVEIGQMVKALDRLSLADASPCCVSEPGCEMCPLNRRWRIHLESPESANPN